MKHLPVIPLADAEFWQDPYPLLAELRARHRAAVNDQGTVVPLHWDDCEWTIKGTDFINEGIEFLERRGFNEGDALHTWRKHALGVMEGPDHLRVRKLVSGALSKRSIEPLAPTDSQTGTRYPRYVCGQRRDRSLPLLFDVFTAPSDDGISWR